LKLLFDANLSPKLVSRLKDLFPGSLHVFDTGLARNTPDQAIWEHAAARGLTLVTADSDFLDPAKFLGPPPKVVRIENCDYRTSEIEALLRRHAIAISEMDQSSRPLLIIRRAT